MKKHQGSALTLPIKDIVGQVHCTVVVVVVVGAGK